MRLDHTFARALEMGYFMCVGAIISFMLTSLPAQPKILQSIEQQINVITDTQLFTLLDLRASSLRRAMLIFGVSFQFERSNLEGNPMAAGHIIRASVQSCRPPTEIV